MSYAVAQRAREIGIRMALGASAAGVLARVVGGAMMLAALGMALGIAGALALGRTMQSLMFGVTIFDPPTLVVVAAVLALTAGLASFLPARRAARVDPGIALRSV
jgi:putative ABC transport system permease protein